MGTSNLFLLANPRDSEAQSIAVCSRSRKATMDNMERSLRQCFLGLNGTGTVARRVEPPLPEVGEVKVSSID